jgi:hypothetical protein
MFNKYADNWRIVSLYLEQHETTRSYGTVKFVTKSPKYTTKTYSEPLHNLINYFHKIYFNNILQGILIFITATQNEVAQTTKTIWVVYVVLHMWHLEHGNVTLPKKCIKKGQKSPLKGHN